MKDISFIKNYYDKNVVGKLKGFIYGNERVERAWEEINNWLFEPPSNVLEIGCGIGDISYRMAKKYPSAKVLGFDVSENSIKIATELFCENNLNFVQADDISLLNYNDKKFDLIFLIDVFEHIPVNLRPNIYNFIKSNLSDEGIIFISCPTINHQNWLKENQKEGLQPIDEDISINDVIDFSKQIDKNLFFFKEISVWNRGDYLHAIFGKRKYEPFSDRKVEKQLSIKLVLKERLFHKRVKEKELKMRKSLVITKLSTNQFFELSSL